MLVLILPIVIAAQAQADQAAPPLSAQVAALVAQLGADSYEVREAAQKRLQALPPEALPLVSRAYSQTKDAEVRMRLRLYADDYFEKHILSRFGDFRRPGFLGIVQQDGQFEDGTGYVEVLQIVPNTAAEAAGLKVGDKLTAINGQALPEFNGTMAVAKYVQAQRVGDKLTCTIIRDGKELTIDAVLGGLPDEHLDQAKLEELRAFRQMLKVQWWQRGFLTGDTAFVPTVRGEVRSDPPQPRK